MKTKTVKNESHRCHICYTHGVELFPVYSNFYRVTSDCKPWQQGGKLGVCRSCGCVQKICDDDFYNECSQIYDSYSVYYQGGDQEQKTFEQSKGMSRYRSELLLTEVFKRFDLPSKGRLLDVGCGNGNLLRSFSALYPYWILAGSELNGKYKQVVEQIENVEALYACDVEEISGQFDMITMLHCLEHIIDPVNFLRKLRNKINRGGLLLIEVPDYTQNPFDLIIADHCSHFNMEDLKKLFHVSGFEIIIATSDYISKELTFLVRKSEDCANAESLKRENSHHHNATMKALWWLEQTVHKAFTIAEQGDFGLFGIAVASTWLCSELGDTVTFFVDEDASRREKEFMGRKVYDPKDVPSDWNVLIVFPFQIANNIWKRMKSYNAIFHLPPSDEQYFEERSNAT